MDEGVRLLLYPFLDTKFLTPPPSQQIQQHHLAIAAA